MFDWLRRRRPYESHEAARAAMLRQAVDRAMANPFALDVGPSDGCADHHSGSSHCDVAPGCDAGTSHH